MFMLVHEGKNVCYRSPQKKTQGKTLQEHEKLSDYAGAICILENYEGGKS